MDRSHKEEMMETDQKMRIALAIVRKADRRLLLVREDHGLVVPNTNPRPDESDIQALDRLISERFATPKQRVGLVLVENVPPIICRGLIRSDNPPLKAYLGSIYPAEMLPGVGWYSREEADQETLIRPATFTLIHRLATKGYL